MTHHVYIATSLDGYIATKSGGLDWLHNLPNPENSDYGFAQFMAGIDALVMGRNTYETVLHMSVWPYDKPVFVLSHSLRQLPKHLDSRAQLVRGNPHDIVEALHKLGLKNLYIDGGQTIAAFLEHGLIDEMTVTVIPILLGDGIPLFSKASQSVQLKHLKTQVLGAGLVKTSYRCVYDNAAL